MAQKEDEIIGILSRIMDEQRDARAENTKLFSDLDKKVDLHIQKTEYELKEIHKQDSIQNDLLDKHIEGVNTLKLMFEKHEEKDATRFANLEEPRRILKGTMKAVIWIGGLGTALTGVMELVSWLKGN